MGARRLHRRRGPQTSQVTAAIEPSEGLGMKKASPGPVSQSCLESRATPVRPGHPCCWLGPYVMFLFMCGFPESPLISSSELRGRGSGESHGVMTLKETRSI